MAYHVVYEMVAKPGEGEALGKALGELKKIVLTLPHVEQVDLLASLENSDTFLFLEKWPSKEGYAEGAKELPKSAFAPIKDLLGAPPSRREYGTLS